MKTTFTTILLTLTLNLQVHAYLSVPDDALNVRHFHAVERGEGGEIVGRSFSNTFDLVGRDEDGVLERRRCTTINACGTAGGCMVMAGQRYCDGVPWQKSFQDAVKQTGANGVTGLKLIAEGMGRGPVGMIANMAKTTAKAIIDGNKKGNKKKRELVDENTLILNRRNFEIVERDEHFNLVERGEYSTFDLLVRNEDGPVLIQRCNAFKSNVSCQ